MDEEDRQWDELIGGVRAGTPAALHAFVQRFRPGLERLAERRISPPMRRRFGPESVAQSVCRTFLRRVQEDRVELRDGDATWRLLCAIALNKVRERVRFHRRERRAVDRERRTDIADGSTSHLPGREPAPDEGLEFAEQLAAVLGELEEEERRVIELRLADHTQVEIATDMGISERTVRRLLRRLETRLTSAFDA